MSEAALALRPERTTAPEEAASTVIDLVESVRQWWWANALCRTGGYPLEMFFPSDERASGPALRVCHACPVEKACLDWALRRNGPAHGVFGGKTPSQRNAMRGLHRRHR
jgi:WhiB family redox-sensing transcriptional regulator